jgi:hypothetical protein
LFQNISINEIRAFWFVRKLGFKGFEGRPWYSVLLVVYRYRYRTWYSSLYVRVASRERLAYVAYVPVSPRAIY